MDNKKRTSRIVVTTYGDDVPSAAEALARASFLPASKRSQKIPASVPGSKPPRDESILRLTLGVLEQKQQAWGPLLIVFGTTLIFWIQAHGAQAALPMYVALALAVALTLSGTLMMFWQLGRDANATNSAPLGANPTEPELAVAQLTKNYDLLRRQTTQGFLMSGVFMALGLLVILSGSAGQLFGFTKEGSNLVSVAGIIMEFISATSLAIYRANFRQLNDTSARLDTTRRVLTAHRLTESLPEEKKAEATLRLIEALITPNDPKGKP